MLECNVVLAEISQFCLGLPREAYNVEFQHLNSIHELQYISNELPLNKQTEKNIKHSISL